jgi:hypothetical protein
MPFIPVPTVARAGAMPFGTLANYKVAYANGDFGGISAVTTWAPNLKSNFAFVQIEEETFNNERTNNVLTARGEDWAIIASVELTPFKGLDIRPLYSYAHIDGPTSGSARRTINDASLSGGSTLTAARQGDVEGRHTVGLDARFRSGPFSLDPTFLFQFGDRDFRNAAGASFSRDIKSWLVDIQGGFQLGPLLLEARGMWTPGNSARDVASGDDIRVYEPLDLDTGYWSGWSNIFALGIDYFNGGAAQGQMATNVGYDRYGRIGGGFRATYSLTPELAFYGVVSAFWTDKEVDTDTAISAAGNRTAPAAGGRGDESFLGVEPNIGMTWRFAPNTVFDLVGAYLFAGDAWEAQRVAGDASTKTDPKDGWTVAARIRMSF